MSRFQRRVWGRLAREAALESARATGELLALLGDAGLREELRAQLPEVAALDAAALLGRLRAEVRAAELTTAFLGTDSEAAGRAAGVDCSLMNLSVAAASNLIYNSWELQFRGLRSACSHDEQVMEDEMQRVVFGCRPFSGGAARPATHREAEDRILYTAVNMRHLEEGECQYGSVRLVLSRRYVEGMALLAPVDTGWFSGACVHGGNVSSALDCSGWPAPYRVGTLADLDHVLLAHARLISSHFKSSVPAAMSYMLGKLIAPRRFSVSTGRDIDVFGYLEGGLLGNAIYPHAVRFVLGHFPALFGTAAGSELVGWCRTHGWPLLWVFGVAPLDGLCAWDMSGAGHAEKHARPRLLEPRTVESTNASMPLGAATAMAALWDEVAGARSSEAPPLGRWRAWWRRAAAALGPEGQLEGLQAGLCRDEESSMGVDARGRCVSIRASPVVVV